MPQQRFIQHSIFYLMTTRVITKDFYGKYEKILKVFDDME